MLVGGVPVDERLLRRLAEVVPPAVARRLDLALFYRAAVLGAALDAADCVADRGNGRLGTPR